jgi:hypothetical protein
MLHTFPATNYHASFNDNKWHSTFTFTMLPLPAVGTVVASNSMALLRFLKIGEVVQILSGGHNTPSDGTVI